jgi:hypothetical protein
VVWDRENKEIQNNKNVKVVIEKYDPTPELEETLDDKITRMVDSRVDLLKSQPSE